MKKVTSKTERCPQCNADWKDKPIPEQYWEHYSAPYWYMRQIAIYDRDVDATVEYMCPDCNTRFARG